MTTEVTNLLIRGASGFLHAGDGVKNTTDTISREEGVLKVSISENSDCVVLIPANTSFSFLEGSIFQGHDIGSCAVNNESGQIARLIYNQDLQEMDLQLFGEYPEYSIYIENFSIHYS